MGCPTNAKQSMLVTTIPSALDHGATLVTRARAERLLLKGDRADGLDCTLLDAGGLHATGRRLRLRARHYVLAGGAINTPALLLRSKAPDPSRQLGKRTFLHPTLVSAALFPQRVDGYAGAPQTVYSDHFLHTQAIDGPLGFKLEAPPLHPVLLATTMQGFGREHAEMMRRFPHLQGMLALLRDGFHPESQGGTVWDGTRRALLTMAEIQFAAGATGVQVAHERAPRYASWADAKAGIAALPFERHLTRVVSAHVMGGCAMADRDGVTGPDGSYRGLSNVSVHDGSLFPTSIGANPQLSIYGITARLASDLAQTLTGRPAARPA
jgi:choline dehydrogenase-like flavoprotein